MYSGEADRENATAFKRAQLRHRRQGDNPDRIDDRADWIDFNRQPNENDDRIILLSLPDVNLDGQTYYKGPMFGLRDFPGFVFAPQALGDDVQNELAFQSVTKYCETPHKTNIDQCAPKANEEIDESSTMWEHWKEENKHQDFKPKKQKLSQSGKRGYRSFKKLSWATMGYHYDWTERSYNKNLKSEMPALVGRLSDIFARTSLFLESGKLDTESTGFTPSASIVNFYSTKSNMGGHRDDLEFALDKPIVSMSVGLPAIFLLGGKSKDDEPVLPILIRPGDVLCMGGDSRLNYHGMARLLPSSVIVPTSGLICSPADSDRISLPDIGMKASNISSSDSQPLNDFLCNHRININVRQVYTDDDDKILESV